MVNDPQRRPDLSNTSLMVLVILLLLALALFVIAKPFLPDVWQKPGSKVLQSMAIAGALLLLAPFGFFLGKRTGLSSVPNRLFILHVIASVVGIFLVAIHALGRIEGPPLVLLLCLVILLATGVFARTHLAPRMAGTFATKPAAFLGSGVEVKDRLAHIIGQKTLLLEQLDARADEALFSVTLKHWLSSPLRSFAYHRLVKEEEGIIGMRRSVPPLQAYWRALHLYAALIFAAGLAAHVIVVTFFAGYVAAGRPIYWWHLTAW